jgi:hypothetical protein
MLIIIVSEWRRGKESRAGHVAVADLATFLFPSFPIHPG